MEEETEKTIHNHKRTRRKTALKLRLPQRINGSEQGIDAEGNIEEEENDALEENRSKTMKSEEAYRYKATSFIDICL